MLDTLQVLQVKKYIISNAQKRKNLCIYVQALFYYAGKVQMTSRYNQLMIV